MNLSEKLIDKIREVNKQYDGVIDKAIKGGRFKLLFKNDNLIGFFTWREIWKDGKLHIYIQNLNIDPDHQKEGFSLTELKRFFREKYNHNYRFVYWYNGRRQRYCYGG